MEPIISQRMNRSPASNQNTKNWFEVDKEGLARILERKGKEFALFELIQNAWDEPGVSKVSVTLEYRGWNKARLVVEDDAPEGFRDLTHAFTLFADSVKKSNPEQRGRFNLGEKLVLAISDKVTIRTTKGGLRFDKDGRHSLRSTQSAGSRVECLINGTVVAGYEKSALVAAGRLKSTDGVYGLRFAHNTEVIVSGLTMTKN